MPPHGLVLGKFLPPHRGHLYLIDFARDFTPDLTVVVGSLASEPIPGALRRAWLKELYPELRVVHLTDENPQQPDQHPHFWEIWRASLLRVSERPVDLLFASESYGAPLAHALGATFVPTNVGRSLFPVSGTAVREDPFAHWDLLPPSVQAYYAKRVALFGPESTGKTRLANRLAEEFEGIVVPEYARTYLEDRPDSISLADMTAIARGQKASEEALARAGRPMLFCDTDPLTTAVWSRELLGSLTDDLAGLAEHNPYDLTLLLDVDVPWVKGELRLRPEGREEFLGSCRQALESAGRTWVMISGSWEERWQKARSAVQELINPRLP